VTWGLFVFVKGCSTIDRRRGSEQGKTGTIKRRWREKIGGNIKGDEKKGGERNKRGNGGGRKGSGIKAGEEEKKMGNGAHEWGEGKVTSPEVKRGSNGRGRGKRGRWYRRQEQ